MDTLYKGDDDSNNKIIYCNVNFNGEYRIVIVPDLSGPHGVPDYRGLDYQG